MGACAEVRKGSAYAGIATCRRAESMPGYMTAKAFEGRRFRRLSSAAAGSLRASAIR
jgi:hypothetical protein